MKVRLSDDELKSAVLGYLNSKGMGVSHDNLTVRFDRVGKKIVVLASIDFGGKPDEKQAIEDI